jgi:hypothetical protein
MAKEVNVTGWVGWVYFAGFVLLINGVFQVIAGLTALLNDKFYAAQQGTLVVFDLTTWGWIHLLFGIVAMCVGTALFSGRAWARFTAVVLASLNLVTYFAFMSEYPLWSGIAMVLNVLVIYALVVHGNEAAVDA